MFDRWYRPRLAGALRRPYVQVLFGARQTGKSTLVRELLPPEAFVADLSDPELRSRYLARPGEFVAECRALAEGTTVFVDEVQSVPAVFDAVQHLYDADRRRLAFVLCGSSARKLRRTGANLLPGRSVLHHLVPLVLGERPPDEPIPPQPASPLALAWPAALARPRRFPAADLVERLAFGDLPGVVTASPADRVELLRAYSIVHLEEEIRREALVKDWGAFVRFLRLAALESGGITNFAGISREAGLSQPTVKAHYQLLEDMFVGFRVPAFTKSPRKNLLSTPKFLFFDLGVRHGAAGLRPSRDLVAAAPGPLFEQWVGIELWKRLQYLGDGNLHYLRSRDGAEIDFIVEYGGVLTPIEVKWTEHPDRTDARHLRAFLDENPRRAKHAYVVCRCARPMRLDDRVTAVPWFSL
jgi:predicted AAA+ superfamily ATPase